MKQIQDNYVVVAIAVGIGAMYFLNRAQENYYDGERRDHQMRSRLRQIEERMSATPEGFIPVSKTVKDKFPISRYNPPRIQERKV